MAKVEIAISDYIYNQSRHWSAFAQSMLLKVVRMVVRVSGVEQADFGD
jgi:hypothetical protein